MSDKTRKSESEWRDALTPDQYQVTRQAGTEAPFSGEYNDCKEDGVYTCVCCGAELFRSDDKYDSGSGWPSYVRPYQSDRVSEHRDASMGTIRTEVRCSRCEAHLGHVFPDGPPQETGLRYCINSLSLKLEKDE